MTNEQKEISSQIYKLLLEHGNFLRQSPDIWNDCQHQREKIERLVAQNASITMVLPAFPAKSPNPQKTIGRQPDLGELMGLGLLNSLCQQIKDIYVPGAETIICSDGRVFSDLVEVSDSHVSQYGEGIKEILAEEGFEFLKTYSLEDIFIERDFDKMRGRLVKEFGSPVNALREEVLAGGEMKDLFNGIHRFIFEDRSALFPEKSRNKIRIESKTVAYQVIQRSNAWSRLVEREFPDAIRLSIHPQVPSSQKLGIRLVPSKNIWGTPWHGTLVRTPQGFWLMKRSEAEKMNARLAWWKGKYGYFELAS